MERNNVTRSNAIHTHTYINIYKIFFLFFFEGSCLLMMTLGMVWHLGPPLAWWSPMKMSPFTFQTEFRLASDHSAWTPPPPLHSPTPRTRTTRKRPPPGPSLSPGDHCGNTWWHGCGMWGVWMYSGCYSLLKDLSYWAMISPFDVSC